MEFPVLYLKPTIVSSDPFDRNKSGHDDNGQKFFAETSRKQLPATLGYQDICESSTDMMKMNPLSFGVLHALRKVKRGASMPPLQRPGR